MTLKRRKISDEGRPKRAWRLMWRGFVVVMGSRSREVVGSGQGKKGVEKSGLGSSGSEVVLSAMNKRTRPLQRWVEFHFSSQL